MRTEWFPLVNEEGETIGKATRKECHSGSKLLHPVIHLHIFNKDGDLYLQKRSMNKDIQPGKWDTAVGGHIDYGESVEEALRREVREELGITDFTPVFIKRYIFESSIEKELVNSFRTTYDGPITPDPEGNTPALGGLRERRGPSATPSFLGSFSQKTKLSRLKSQGFKLKPTTAVLAVGKFLVRTKKEEEGSPWC